MSFFTRIPAAVLFCLATPAYLLIFLMFMDQFSFITFSPRSVPYDEAVPLLVSLSLLAIASWQFAVIRKASNRQGLKILLLLIAGVNIIQCSFLLIISIDNILRAANIASTGNARELLRSVRTVITPDQLLALILSGLVLAPLAAAVALTAGLEKKPGFMRWLLASVMILLFPLGIWWLQPRVIRAIPAKNTGITDHFGI
ncbi:hypothetical protein FUA23_00560 [Neolewinella aurantiaca]|uniref:Uncharacterized protein n=1 Tax=Neolewinella aurantiaca TaxID=2602767 RepID=A0A5C7FLX3_9BACT|nr:hypothetical protein [Neolewinella aurantiaca]TXF91710.1 hypothetical protein FUA23_00560 [Neolewinella aurantiaca]